MFAWENTKCKRKFQWDDLGPNTKRHVCFIAILTVWSLYDVVSNFNIGMKASVLTIEKIGFDAGVCTLRDCKKFNVKCISLPNSRITPKNKLGRQLLRAKRTVQK